MRMLPQRRRVLWRLHRAGQLVRCDCAPHAFGLELRQLVNGKLVMSRVFETRDALDVAATAWLDGLLQRGWREARPQATGPVRAAS